MARSGLSPKSHDGKALAHILDTYPRDELFQGSEDELFDTGLGILNLQERQRIALFVRRDPLKRFCSCLVYVPRERYGSDLRRRFVVISNRPLGVGCRCFTRISTIPRWRASSSSSARRAARYRRSILQPSNTSLPRPVAAGRIILRKKPPRHSARPKRGRGCAV